MPGRISDRQMLTQLMRKHDELGRWPTREEMAEDSNLDSMDHFSTRFGGMLSARRAALLQAGRLTDEEMQEVMIERDRLLRELAHFIAESDVRFSRAQFKMAENMSPLSEYSRYCGGIDSALRMLDLPVTIPDEDDLIDGIKRFYAEYDRVPLLADCHYDGCGYDIKTYRSKFIFWNNALIAAGFEPNLDQPNRRETLRRRRLLKEQEERAVA